MRRLVIRREARADILEARTWYDRDSNNVGDRFLLAVDTALTALAAAPNLWPDFGEGVRRSPVRGFPYSVYYFTDERRLTVFAVMHYRRDPLVWRRRAGLNEDAANYAATGAA